MPQPKVKSKPKRKSKLAGSCQCGKVTFSVDSETPVPFMFCFCSICRKTGGTGFGCNIMGLRETLKVTGKSSLRVHRARVRESGKRTVISKAKRWFCVTCGSHLYLTDDRWPTGLWPYVSAIDTPLPAPKKITWIMTRFKPSWFPSWMVAKGKAHAGYPDVSIAAWHEREGWPVSVKP